MKIAYKHLVKHIADKPSLEDISKRLFQLGHEHEIHDGIFDMEFTPNRGDCLSINGLLRDLTVFYDVAFNVNIFEGDLPELSFDFHNHSIESCPLISFLKIEIDGQVKSYNGDLQHYHDTFSIKKNNFFSDISNYISYETGQPTHCYDYEKIGKSLSLQKINEVKPFKTLLGKELQLNGTNLVFVDDKNEIINLAGIMGGKSTACSLNTRSVLVECALFNPEDIIGKSIKYDIYSEAAHKFERGVDPQSHEMVLRRFIAIVQDHSNITNIEFNTFRYQKDKEKKIPFDTKKINQIIGINISDNEYINFLTKLEFKVNNNEIIIPSFRNDIFSSNDLAEEVARVIGYDKISRQPINIPESPSRPSPDQEKKLKSFLVDNGFYEVINNSFISEGIKDSIKVDNPLDSNRKFIRTELKNSLINNLLFNERRQKDSIKLFEISDTYSGLNNFKKQKKLGVIASGRVGKNYLEFSKKIDKNYIENIFKDIFDLSMFNIENISRESLSSKIKSQIIYLEIDLDKNDYHFENNISSHQEIFKDFKKYSPISDFPVSTRDLSFSIENFKYCETLENLLINYKHELLIDVYVFDYFLNQKNSEIKMGFRFTFQNKMKTITDEEVDAVIDGIIKKSMQIEYVNLPGLKHDK